jgi:hypothetical protein
LTEQEKRVGGVGVVRVGNLEITVTPLKQWEERALSRQLRKAAREECSDYFTRCAGLLKAMQSQPAAYLEAVRELTRLSATGPTVSEDQFWEYRDSPAGVARELFARGKTATPGLDLAALSAVITEANVDEVLEQLRAAVEGGDPKPSTP